MAVVHNSSNRFQITQIRCLVHVLRAPAKLKGLSTRFLLDNYEQISVLTAKLSFEDRRVRQETPVNNRDQRGYGKIIMISTVVRNVLLSHSPNAVTVDHRIL